MNKTTRPLDNDEVIKLISTIKSGYITIDENTKKIIKRRGNDKIAFALYLESVLGIRISDILNLSLSSFHLSDYPPCLSSLDSAKQSDNLQEIHYIVSLSGHESLIRPKQKAFEFLG